jgi:hypothetical protein
MQEILLEVVEKTDMRGREFSIFIIDEPEAAVTFALRHENIRENIEVRMDAVALSLLMGLTICRKGPTSLCATLEVVLL